MFSGRDLTKLIIPLLIEQILGITVGIADSMMVASAGEAAVSGVSLVDSLTLLLIYVFSALAGGGAVVLSQFMGKGDMKNTRHAAGQLMWMVFLVSSAIAAFSLLFRKPLLHLIFGSIDADVMKNAQVYFLYIAMCFPFLGLYNGGAAIYRSMGNTKVSMYASVIMNLINVVGNAILIFVFHLGAAGAAISTLFSRIIGAGLMMVLIHNKNNPIYVEKLYRFKPDFAVIKRICGIGIPNGTESGMFQFGKVLTQSLIATFGTVQIAANAVGNSLTSLQYVPGTAIGLAMVTVVGRCIGAGEKEQAEKYTKQLLAIAYACLVTICILMSIFAKPIIGLYNLSPDSSHIASHLILMHSLTAALIWPIAFALPNAFRAASDVRYTMIIAITSMWIFRVGLSYVFGSFAGFGIYGVWIAMFCDWIFRAAIFGIRFLRGTWLTKYKE